VANLGGEVFTVTVENDGLRLDLETAMTTQHFCYLPGSMGDTVSQRTDAVAFDAVHSRIYAQPQTFEGGDLSSAQVGAYDMTEGGQPESWWNLKNEEFAAGGMFYDQPDLKMGSGGMLYIYELASKKMEPYVDLSELGITTIEGLALDQHDVLYVIDGHDEELVVIDGWRP